MPDSVRDVDFAMFTPNDLEREGYEARLKFRRDQSAMLRDAELKGSLVGRIQLCEKLLKQGPTLEEALHAQSLEQLQELANRLEKQLAQRV